MTLPFQIGSHSPAIRALASQHQAENPRLFGSVLKGRAKPGSDIDILVDPLPGATLFDLGALQMALQDLLGAPVDLLTPSDISPKFRSSVLAEAQQI